MICFWERNVEKRREKTAQKLLHDCPKIFQLQISSGKGHFRHFISQKVLGGPCRATEFGGLFEGLLNSDWADIGVPRKLWMSSFWKAKELENPMVGSKLMALENKLTPPS